MNRRQFLKSALIAGAGVSVPLAVAASEDNNRIIIATDYARGEDFSCTIWRKGDTILRVEWGCVVDEPFISEPG